MIRPRPRLPLLAALAAVAAGFAVGPAHAAAIRPTIADFAELSVPADALAPGPGGNVWLAQEASPGGIARIAPDGTVTEYAGGGAPGFSADARPVGMAAGPDGAMWFLEAAGRGAVARISGGGIVSELGGLRHAPPAGIATGPDEAVWFTEQGGGGAIGRIAADGTITEHTDGLTPGSAPADIAAGPDRALWFTETAGTGAIGRISTDGGITEFRAGLTRTPAAIAAGPDGALWFTQPSGGIGRITTAGVITEYTAGITAGRAPTDIAAGADGALWFTERGTKPAIGRITTDGVIDEFKRGLGRDVVPMSIAPAPHGGMVFSTTTTVVGHLTVPPAVGTTEVRTAGATRASFAGTVEPNGSTTTYRFEYRAEGADWTKTGEVGAGNGLSPVAVAASVDGLAPDTVHRVRVVASNDAGAAVGRETSFRTERAPDDGPGAEAPLPTFGASVVLDVRRGDVRVRVPGQSSFTPLEEVTTLPVGSVVDAVAGAVRLRTALDRSGRTQTGSFSGGRFEVRQSRSGRGFTDLHLRGGGLGACPPAAARSRSAAAAARVLARAAGRRGVRRLWGRDRRGRFRTHGRDSVATVRGTRWVTEDRCDGTRVRVFEGAVLVRERATGRRVLVRAGGSRFTRHRR